MNLRAVIVTAEDEKAILYAEGGMAFHRSVIGGGWCVDDDPSEQIVALALAVRAVAFPSLPALTVAEVTA
jgi:hypothetical protein